MPKSIIKRTCIAIVSLAILCLAIIVTFVWVKRPSLMPRTEIYKGVFLTVEEVPAKSLLPSRAMIVEIHWDAPGVRLGHRDFDYYFTTGNPRTPHFDLQLADRALKQENVSILMNTTIFGPAGIWNSFPGSQVRTNETLVVDGHVSHIHEHTYLFYWDKDGNAHADYNKPPSEEAIQEAILGIGVQGVPIMNGQLRSQGLSNLEESHDRTFIAVDSLENILYLYVFENVTARYMLQRVMESGVVFGGQLDSGKSSHLLIGKEARGISRGTGIRNLRPLAGYLTVTAEPLP